MYGPSKRHINEAISNFLLVCRSHGKKWNEWIYFALCVWITVSVAGWLVWVVVTGLPGLIVTVVYNINYILYISAFVKISSRKSYMDTIVTVIFFVLMLLYTLSYIQSDTVISCFLAALLLLYFLFFNRRHHRKDHINHHHLTLHYFWRRLREDGRMGKSRLVTGTVCILIQVTLDSTKIANSHYSRLSSLILEELHRDNTSFNIKWACDRVMIMISYRKCGHNIFLTNLEMVHGWF